MATQNIQATEAKHGEKMIEIKVRFWTNDIAPKEGQIVPKHAWSCGGVRMEGNKSHGIVPTQPRVFHSPLEVGAVMEKVLMEQGVMLHPSRQMRKYFEME